MWESQEPPGKEQVPDETQSVVRSLPLSGGGAETTLNRLQLQFFRFFSGLAPMDLHLSMEER